MPVHSSDDLHAVVLIDAQPGDLLPVALPPTVADSIDSGRAYVIAADSGLHVASPLGVAVDLVVGDLDSVRPEVLAAAEQAGSTIDRHPEDKDATDLALALQAAVKAGATRLTLLGGAGGRLDHTIANALVLAHPSLAHLEVRAVLGGARLAVVRAGEMGTSLQGDVDDLVSLLPLGGAARGVTTTGLRWELTNADLDAFDTRPVSNRFATDEAHVRVTAGTVLAVQPPTP